MATGFLIHERYLWHDTRSAGLFRGRLVLSHDGGYSTGYVPFCGLAVMEEFSGTATGVEDPFLSSFEGMGHNDLQPDRKRRCARPLKTSGSPLRLAPR